MLFHIIDDSLAVRIRVTVATEVTAGIVGSDVPGNKAGTFPAVVRISREDQILSDSSFKDALCHAAGTIGTDSSEFPALPAVFYRHAIFLSNIDKSLCQGKLRMERDSFGFRKISLHFLIQINEADYRGMCTPLQNFAHFPKGFHMSVGCPGFV